MAIPGAAKFLENLNECLQIQIGSSIYSEGKGI